MKLMAILLQKCISLQYIMLITFYTVMVCGQNCDFERDFCDWMNTNSWAKANWSRTDENTLTKRTGPQTGHTYNDTGNFYAYLNVRDSRNQNQIVNAGYRAVLVSPSLPSNGSRLCFQFYYYMYGSAVGNLTAGTVTVNASNYADEASKREILHRSGDKGESWLPGTFIVEDPSTKRIYIEATTGENIQSDIAIDDLTIILGNCGSATTTTKTPVITRSQDVITQKTSSSVIGSRTSSSVIGSSTAKPPIDYNLLLYATIIPIALIIIIVIIAFICYKNKYFRKTNDIMRDTQMRVIGISEYASYEERNIYYNNHYDNENTEEVYDTYNENEMRENQSDFNGDYIDLDTVG